MPSINQMTFKHRFRLMRTMVSRMLMGLMAVCLTVILTLPSTSLAQQRAASVRPNCNCQCSNFVFKSKYGRVQGNCKS